MGRPWLVGSADLAFLVGWLPALCPPLALVGFLDDRHKLPGALAASLHRWLRLLNFTNFMAVLNGFVAGCMAMQSAPYRLRTFAPPL